MILDHIAVNYGTYAMSQAFLRVLKVGDKFQLCNTTYEVLKSKQGKTTIQYNGRKLTFGEGHTTFLTNEERGIKTYTKQRAWISKSTKGNKGLPIINNIIRDIEGQICMVLHTYAPFREDNGFLKVLNRLTELNS